LLSNLHFRFEKSQKIKNKKKKPELNPMNSFISGLPKASQTSQSIELGRFRGGLNKLRNHNNGAMDFHICMTIATSHIFLFSLFFLLFPYLWCYKWWLKTRKTRMKKGKPMPPLCFQATTSVTTFCQQTDNEKACTAPST
jgi:hypothetical protein